MTPALWALRALNLAAALAAARLGLRSYPLGLPAAVLAAVLAAEGAAVFAGRPAEPRRRRAVELGVLALDLLLILGLAFWAVPMAGAFDPAFLLPALLIALERGAPAGAAAGALPVLAVGLLLTRAASPELLPVVLARAVFFAAVPAAAGLALPAARADSAARARRTIARLRAAQVGEYIGLTLFQLRDYLISISALAESIALSAPKDDARLQERVERLRRSAAEFGAKMARLLGDKSALTSVAPPSRQSVDLPALARAAAAEARAAFAPGGPAVDVVVQGEVPPLESERRPIELALLAALQNSLEACAARGAGRVTVFVRADAAGAELEVADDGGGIPETSKPFLFEPLAAARAGADGMGLGLSMSRRFLERLGGTLKVKSGGGATAVLLVVPLSRELPRIRNEESTWAGRRAGEPGSRAGA